MNGKFVVVLLMSLIGITLYWFPVPIIIGSYVLGGYPWLAPEPSKNTMIIIGLAITVTFLALTAIMYYITKKLEEVGPEEAYEEPEERPATSVEW
ncbi:MAG: hypothetical protein ACP5II_03555 [Infirmifilum sp.]|jgi:ABC-type Fe3+-siderophore transport system permease subunit|uniref:hypothetical protein n=1 Tax=Infirmifilum TaxID=2856573 RepID=UPI00235518DD